MALIIIDDPVIEQTPEQREKVLDFLRELQYCKRFGHMLRISADRARVECYCGHSEPRRRAGNRGEGARFLHRRGTR